MTRGGQEGWDEANELQLPPGTTIPQALATSCARARGCSAKLEWAWAGAVGAGPSLSPG